MANHSGHIVANCFFGGCITGILGLSEVLGLQELSIATSGFFIGTFLLSPDLDLNHSKVNRNWGIFRFIWFPYALAFKHRGLSHHVIYGTFSRILYFIGLAFITIVLMHLFDTPEKLTSLSFLNDLFLFPEITDYLELTNTNFLHCSLFFAGIYISDICHLFMDSLFSASKKLSKNS